MAMIKPKTVGATADKLHELREKRLSLSKQVDALAKGETILREHGIALLNEQGLTSGSGQVATMSIAPTVVPSVEDWDQLYQYISSHEAFELLQRRVSVPAWRDRVEADGASIQGVKGETITKVSLTKKRK